MHELDISAVKRKTAILYLSLGVLISGEGETGDKIVAENCLSIIIVFDMLWVYAVEKLIY